ncbi:MAG: hypothetical protein WC510_02745 [Candidatus Omnitrophota bacterium]
MNSRCPYLLGPVFTIRFLICFMFFFCGILTLGNISVLPAAEEKNGGLEEKVIAGTFKSLAKAFLLGVDMEKIKKDNIAVLNKMDDEKFLRRYAKIYSVIKDCPFIVRRYGIREDMTREEAIYKIRDLNKKEAYKIIDSIPDRVIALEFRKYLSEKRRQIGSSSLVAQINAAWAKFTRAVGVR